MGSLPLLVGDLSICLRIRNLHLNHEGGAATDLGPFDKDLALVVVFDDALGQ